MMAKYSDDRFELGASRVPALVLGETKFTTNERERLKTIHAQKGIPTLETEFGKEAKKRGNYLEEAIIQWAVDELEEQANFETSIQLGKVTHGYRLDDIKLCASLDAILNVEGSLLLKDAKTRGHMELSGMGAVEIKTSNSDDSPRIDQVIQLQAQLMCSGFEWGIIAVFGKQQRLSLTPFKADTEMHDIIREKVEEFWTKVGLDEPYPALDNGPAYTINLDHIETKEQVIQLSLDWLKADNEIKAWAKTKQECQEALEIVMKSNQAEIAEIGEFKILNPIIKRKAQPEKVVPAKPPSYYKKFKIERKHDE